MQTLITKLQEKCYIVTSDFIYLRDKNGNPYGWGVAEYSTPEKFFGKTFANNVYKRTLEKSYERLFKHLQELLPDGADDDIIKLLN